MEHTPPMLVAFETALGMSTIAEGVETDAQREVLLDLGCGTAQGYLLGRPAPGDSIDARLGAVVPGTRMAMTHRG